MNLEDLAEQIKQCQKCGLYRAAKNAVPGEGNPSAEIMFVGEGPGQTEDEQGRPFVGAAGKLLEELLASIGLKREDVFIANVVKHRPPGNRDPLPEEIEACTPWLLEQINIIKPKLIVTLGRHSMGHFMPGLRISAVHGQPKRRAGQVYLPLYHPAAALYQNSLRQTLEEDFKKIPLVINKINESNLSN